MKPKKQTMINRIHRIALMALFSMMALAVCGQPDNRFRQPHSRNQFQVLLYTSHDTVPLAFRFDKSSSIRP